MNKNPEKTLEDVVREKFATGYDPIKLQASLKQNNEENLVITIEGKTFSLRDNTLSLIEKKSHAAPTTGTDKEGPPAPPADPEHPVNQEPPAPTENPTAGGAEDQGSTAPAPSSTPELEERIQAVLRAHSAAELVTDGTADSGETIYVVMLENGDTVGRGTIAELEAGLQNKAAAESNAA